MGATMPNTACIMDGHHAFMRRCFLAVFVTNNIVTMETVHPESVMTAATGNKNRFQQIHRKNVQQPKRGRQVIQWHLLT